MADPASNPAMGSNMSLEIPGTYWWTALAGG